MATYLILNFIVMAAILVLLRVNFPRAGSVLTSVLPLAVLLLLTLIFDNLIIHLGIVVYDNAKTAGIRLGLAPLEDFAYAVLAFLVVPHLYNRFRSKPDKDAS